jgi:crotonobetainyl-CoA:carnitine CoA-transferase CaiB-like acyl-CoA transferase
VTNPDLAPGPLAGLLVADLSRVLAGPACAQLLGDLGAEVIKVERPGRGDDTRGWGPPFLETEPGAPAGLRSEQSSAYYLCANRNKRSLALDLGAEAGREVLFRLLERADVLVENFKSGDLERYGLGYEQLKGRFPRLIYCSISGFGRTGPRAHQPGYDALIQAMGGIMSLTGEPEGEPMKVGVAATDVITGLYAAVGLLAALRHRDRTGLGQRIDLSLYDAQLSWLVNAGVATLMTGRPPARRGNGHPQIVPYQLFPCADGRLLVAVGNDAQFARLCAALGEPSLAEGGWGTNAGRVADREALVARLSALFEADTRARWIERLGEARVPAGPVRDLKEALSDPVVEARGMRVRVPHPSAAAGEVELLGNPLRLSGSPVRYRRPPPGLGEHSEALLEELGFDEAQRASLRERGALG